MSDLPDLKKLREVAEKATPGPWLCSGRYIGTPRHMSYIGECRDKNGNWSDDVLASSNGRYIATFNPQTILALLDAYEAIARDAERYQWIRNDQTGAVETVILIDPYGDVEVKVGEILDKAIDAARHATKGE
jgi:hypothetical protein